MNVERAGFAVTDEYVAGKVTVTTPSSREYTLDAQDAYALGLALLAACSPTLNDRHRRAMRLADAQSNPGT